jgi:hypothetical protein
MDPHMAVKSTKAIGSCVAPREDGRQAGAMRCDTRRAASSTSAPPCMRLFNWPRRRRSVPMSPRALLTSPLCPVRKRVGPAVPCPPGATASKRSRSSSPRRQSARSLHLPPRTRAVARTRRHRAAAAPAGGPRLPRRLRPSTPVLGRATP